MLCPPGAAALTNFTDAAGAAWLACEDFSTPTGGLTLVSAAETVHLPKTHAPYASQPDDAYYLGLGKQAVLDAAPHRDVLGQALLACNHSSSPHTTCFSWSDVERAVPPIRKSGQGGHSDNWEACQGVRSFVGSRSSSNDATFSDFGEDCSHNGFPSALGMLAPGYSVVNWTAVHTGEGAIADWTKYINFTAVADGLVGGTLPILALYFPVLAQNPYHKLSGARHWTMIAAPVPDGGGKREQDVWFRFAQVDCDRAGPDGYGVGASCTAKTQTWETYWYTRNPGKADDAFGPEVSASDAGFYANLLAVHRYWNATLAAEGMMALSLPEAVGTNGTWLQQQATHSLVRSMISRRDTWHPTYGVNPGYGWRGQDGFQDVFTSTATMALEWGALPFAKGVIDNQWNFYVRHDGLINYRAIEVPTVARFLTLLALYHSYSGDDALLLSHFAKAKALAGWLSHRRKLALAYDTSDPRYGIPFGNDEADSYSHTGGFSGHTSPGGKIGWLGLDARLHYLSSAAEAYRAFVEMGAVWRAVGKATGRGDISTHATELLETAPLLLHDLHASLNRTLHLNGEGERCWAHTGEPNCGLHFRTIPEMFYSAALRDDQIGEMYRMGAGAVDCAGARGCPNSAKFLSVGCPAGGSLIFTHIPFGLAYGLLLADMPDEFLLHYFASTAHSYTRGSWTTPESAQLDRDAWSIAYNTAGQTIAPIYLKWALAFEDPRSQTLWLAKGVPREMLEPGVAPIDAQRVPTRYGRVGLRLHAAAGGDGGGLVVHANLTLPAGFAPPGGLRLRLRAPLHAGRLVAVRVGGEAWSDFDDATVSFGAAALTPALLGRARDVVATFERA